MRNLMVEPRKLMVSNVTVSRPFGVILTARRAVFIWGETEVMVPWRMVPVGANWVSRLLLLT